LNGMPISPEDFDRLSAYLDDALPRGQRLIFEQRLEDNSELRGELDSLRRTRQILRAAPILEVPHNFTLDTKRYGRPLSWWANYRAMESIGALSALAALLLIVFGVLTSGPMFTANNAVPTNLQSNPPATSVAVLATLVPTTTSDLKDSTVSTAAKLAASPQPSNLPATMTLIMRATPLPSLTVLPSSAKAVPNIVQSDTTLTAAVIFMATSMPMTLVAATDAAPYYGSTNAAASGSSASDSALSSPTFRSNPPNAAILPSATAANYQPRQSFGTVTATGHLDFAGSATAVPSDTPDLRPLPIAVEPTTAAPAVAQPGQGGAIPFPLPRFALILGIALLVLGIMLFGIGYLRSRIM
jgi:hypothetical protein